LSKDGGKILYAKNTPVVMNKILTVASMNVVALLVGGMKGVGMCWQPKCLTVFGMIGVIYALGDWLEMLSMAKLSGGVYQVLLQTKLLITALMLWWIKGSKQTSLQWHVLFSMFLSVSAFVLVDQGGDGGGASLPLAAMMCVVLKVAVSCYCAVLSEKYMKQFADMPIYAKISGLSTTWAIASLVLCATEKQVTQQGFFAHWDINTWYVTGSFVVKTVSTQILLQALDSVQKNIGEALALIVIYIWQVASAASAFELSVFLLAVLVVALVKTYLIAPKMGAQAPKAGGLAKKMRIVNLRPEGSQQMQRLGVNSMLCEVQGALPPSVFYGMLGGVHPVCGNTDPQGSGRCELMMLAHPPVGQGGARVTSSVEPYLPDRTLSVLGEVRKRQPGENITTETCMKDLEQARAKFFSSLSPADSPV